MDSISNIRRKGQGTLNESATGERLTPTTVNLNVPKREIRKMSLLERTQTYLKRNPDFPQEHFEGQHKINIQVPAVKGDFTQDQINDLVETVFQLKTVQDVTAQISKLVAERIGVLAKNAGNAEKTRTPQVGSTANRGWKSFIATKDYAGAERMFDAMVATQDVMGYTDRQIEGLRKELESIKS